MAVGGCANNQDLVVAELYLRRLNLWEEMPSLNEARSWPGSCIVAGGKTAFVFGGTTSNSEMLNSIEKLQLWDSHWKMLPRDPRIIGECHLAAV